MQARFTHRNPGFTCEHCGQEVLPLAKGCRNHCPSCLRSKHVDRFPGDRDNPCLGTMTAVSYSLSGKKGLILAFKCQRCGAQGQNKAALDDPRQPDNYEAILRL